ncbi:hypothetical protein LTR35_010630 [Friedmanniomyces endolithicus]|uniref:Xylanolytic transcriptional activator regulatory domain-containing protein n=1 Tax=Friedmanniomyces endolithicus TaxID=329885 RepID=A0AAN6J703_9PEZI|nr:hypothetical protein LTR35_010630 [Friedmanniomyces endolithicus]KAK0300972.1 hypothetical protein LTS00_000120 [Friedmanniomyces endolithicus]KAK0318750.1 hypothetical protein LTR82_010170 [Friedmanniomyces endolithicus]KAK1018951.1 hypothetical protein LTR54_000763 [Friedmanniomyces endolithicus]
MNSPAISPNNDTAYDATTLTQSAVASRLIEQAVVNSPGAYQNAELVAALHSLRDMVGKIEEVPSSTELDPPNGLPKAEQPEPPTEEEIERLLRKAEGSLTFKLSPELTLPILRDKFDSVFRRSEAADAIRLVYVYGLLWNLCTEFGDLEPDVAFAARCKGLARLFTARLEQAVAELKLIIPASAEAAYALAMAAGIAVNQGKAHLALSLSSHAASMVLSLGYHRLSTMQSDTDYARQVKISLFWMVYWFDTSFSVRLGHAPVIRSYDITVPRLSSCSSIMPSAFLVAFNYSTTLSGLQCQVVEQLYSPLALRQSVDERHTRASKLMMALKEALNERQLAASTVPQEPVFGGIQVLFEESDAVMHHSTAYEQHPGLQCGQLADFGRSSALIQHATMSATNSDSPALGSARRALRLNVDAWKNHKHLPDFVWSGHCHWTLLKAPITPFTVTFCHIIAHPFMADADLGLLADYVATLKDLRRFSDGMIKMYRLCDVFCKVATLYVHAKINEAKQGGKIQYHDTPAWIGQPAVNDIDGYLSTIGFAPPPPGGIEGGPDVFGGDEDFDASFLLDWYEGNNSLMGFLEQDLTFPGDLGYGDTA